MQMETEFPLTSNVTSVIRLKMQDILDKKDKEIAYLKSKIDVVGE